MKKVGLRLVVFVCFFVTLASAQEAQQIIETSLALLDKAPFYSVIVGSSEGTASYDFIAPDKLRYHALLEDGLGNTSEGFAIQIGSNYWDKFMDGPWRASTVDTAAPDDLEFFDEETIADVTTLGSYAYTDPTNPSKTVPCQRYGFNTSDESGLYSVVACIDPLSGLPVAFDVTDETGTLFLYYSYQKPADITPPTTVEAE